MRNLIQTLFMACAVMHQWRGVNHFNQCNVMALETERTVKARMNADLTASINCKDRLARRWLLSLHSPSSLTVIASFDNKPQTRIQRLTLRTLMDFKPRGASISRTGSDGSDHSGDRIRNFCQSNSRFQSDFCSHKAWKKSAWH